MWTQHLYRLDGTKEQCNLFHPLGPHTESKGAESPFCYLLVLLHFDCSGATCIVVTVAVSKTLNSPMYFFLASLSFMNLVYSSSTSPDCFQTCSLGKYHILWILYDPAVYRALFSGSQDIPLLLVMAYDAMRPSASPCIIWRSWGKGMCCTAAGVLGWRFSALHYFRVSTVCGLPFCGPNIIDHFMCDMFPLLKLICTDTFVTGISVANGLILHSFASALARLLWSHPALSEEPESGREAGKPLQTCGSPHI